MKKPVSVCFILLMAVLIAGATGAEQTLQGASIGDGPVRVNAAPDLCAEVDAQLNVKIHCAQFLDQRYDFALRYYANVADPSNLYWNLDLESIVSANCDCQNECATVAETTLNINFPCFLYNDTQYDSPIALQRFPNPLDPLGIYWRLVLPPPVISMTLFPMTENDCPGTGSGTVSASGNKEPGEVAVGSINGATPTRGYIQFEGYDNAFSQNPSLKVDSAFLRVYVTDPAAEGSVIRLVSLQDLVNPEADTIQHLCSFRLGGKAIWDEITKATTLTQETIGTVEPGWFDLNLDPAAVEAMLRRTNQNFIGIGMMEVGDNGDALVFEGWNANPLILPQLVIDYYEDPSSPRPEAPPPTK